MSGAEIDRDADRDKAARWLEGVDARIGALAHAQACETIMDGLLRAARADRAAVVTVCAMVLESLGAGMPARGLLDERLRADAEDWAAFAHPAEIEAVVVAGLRAADRAVFCSRARKRLLATLWRDMAAGERAEFLARVDPRGRIRGAA